MKIKRFNTKGCCGTTAVSFKLGASVSKNLLIPLSGLGYKENEKFTQAGILYMENDSIVISGAFGQDLLQAKCKRNCLENLDALEAFLIQLE